MWIIINTFIRFRCLNLYLILNCLIFNCFCLFFKSFTKRKSLNLACSITYFGLEGNKSSPLRYSYLLILPGDKVDIFAASLLISYCSFSFIIWSSIVIIVLYFYFLLIFNFFLNFKGFFDGKVVSFTEIWKWFYSKNFITFHKIFKVNIW